jgi:periplasmic divalent cation tolerance protein
MSVLLVLCSHPDPAAAETLATALVEQRLAACVNVLPGVRSVYRWLGNIEHAQETLLLIKTTSDRLDALKESIVMAHHYAVPEILALSVDSGLERYLDWVRAETMRRGTET